MQRDIRYVVGDVNSDNGSIFQSRIMGKTETVTMSRDVYEQACARADIAIRKAVSEIQTEIDAYIRQTAHTTRK